MRPQTWGKLTAGVLVIGGVLLGLWVAFQPDLDPAVEPEPRPAPPLLQDTHAVVRFVPAGADTVRRATIRCDGRRRRASGFWRRDPPEGCDALASTRAALVSGPGCTGRRGAGAILRVTGAFGARRFDHRAREANCPDVDAWLAVNALVAPVTTPRRKAADADGE